MPKTKISKNKQPIKKHSSFLKKIVNHLYKEEFFYLSGTLAITFLVYFFSLFRQWQAFDERVIYNETIFPIPTKFNEIYEIIKTFVFGYHVESTNSFFSNFITVRSNPLAGALYVFVSFFLKKSAFLYHLFQLLLHLSNTFLVWLIFSKVVKIFNLTLPLKNLFISLFTLLWSLHSVNTEAILLTTNWGALLTYSICLLYIHYELTRISDKNFKQTKKRFFFITILFCLTMFLTEYGYSLPVILFFIYFAYSFRTFGTINKSFFTSLKLCMPYIFGMVLFILFSLLRPDPPLANFTNNQILAVTSELNSSLWYFFIERNLWLVPQIFVYFLKLLLFPITLSTYQSNLLPLAKNLFEPYSVFCLLFYFSFLTLPLILFFVFKKQNFSFIFLLIYAFYFSLFPFLHILMPTYCLIADRYCYFPIFLLLFVLLNLFSTINIFNPTNTKPIITVLVSLTIILGTRTLIRAQDWSDTLTLYKSAIKIEKDPLYKGQKLLILADYLGNNKKQQEMEENLNKSLREFHKSIKKLKLEKKNYKNQPIALKIYGLDVDSLILKSAYGISTIRTDNYQENPKEVLEFFEPYIKNKLYTASPTSLAYYASILSRSEELEKSRGVLEYGAWKYPYCSGILYSLANYYLTVNKNLEKAYEALQLAFYYFPNQIQTLQNLLKYYEEKNDLLNQAKFSYLIGLREHSSYHYKKATQTYLDLNQLVLGEQALRKLLRLQSNDPVSLLLTSRYLDMTGKRGKIRQLLNTAYFLNKALGDKQDEKVTKSILVSLVNVNALHGDIMSAETFLKEFREMKNLTLEDRKTINVLKTRLSTSIEKVTENKRKL